MRTLKAVSALGGLGLLAFAGGCAAPPEENVARSEARQIERVVSSGPVDCGRARAHLATVYGQWVALHVEIGFVVALGVEVGAEIAAFGITTEQLTLAYAAVRVALASIPKILNDTLHDTRNLRDAIYKIKQAIGAIGPMIPPLFEQLDDHSRMGGTDRSVNDAKERLKIVKEKLEAAIEMLGEMGNVLLDERERTLREIECICGTDHSWDLERHECKSTGVIPPSNPDTGMKCGTTEDCGESIYFCDTGSCRMMWPAFYAESFCGTEDRCSPIFCPSFPNTGGKSCCGEYADQTGTGVARTSDRPCH